MHIGRRRTNSTVCTEDNQADERVKRGSLCSPIKWHVGAIVLAGVDLIGAEEFVLLELLQPMGQPARYPRHRKQRREEIGFDSHLVVDHAGIEGLPL